MVWLGWIAPLGLIGALALMGWYFTDRSDNDVALAMVAVFWVFGLLATAGYFEFVNKRLWRSMGIKQKSEGLSPLVAALGVGMVLVLLGPLALVLAVLAWRKIRRAGTPIAEGAATAAVAFVAGAVDTLYLTLSFTGVVSF